MRNHAVAHLSVLATFCSVLLTSPASAQYFGSNKVQYRHLQFQTLKTEHFDVYFTDSDAAAINAAARMAERWHERLSRILLHRLLDRQPLILYNSHPEFEQTNVVPDLLDEATGGFTEPAGRRIVLPLAGPLADTDHVIGHELVHAFQFDMTVGLGNGNGMDRLPLWFTEGLAEYCSLGPNDAVTAMWLRDAARRDALPTIDQLDDPAYFPYRWGHAFWAYVGGRWGDGIIRRLFMVASESGVRAALESVLGRSPQALTQEWHAAIRLAYAPALGAVATRSGQRVPLGTKPERTELNVGPAISPDGRLIAFLSGRNLFSVDLYVADASNGRIVRKLTNTSSSPHFSSLQFIHSAGAWDTDGRRLAVAAMTGGRAALAIFDAATWRQPRDVVIPGVDEIFGPSWAPDGDRICFAAMTRGVTDLYVYDLRQSTLRRLTNDVFADLQPAWSPDGRSIAFATDRYTTHLETMATGRYRLAVLDVESGDVRPVTASTAGDDLNPQWTPDGRAITFVSNRTGIPNVYRTPFDADGAAEQLTNVVTGVSGITGTSPSMSVASKRGVIVFTVFENGVYGVHMVDPAQQPAVGDAALHASTALPPLDRKPSEVGSLTQNYTLGLPRDAGYAVSPHRSSLALQNIGGVAGAAGADPFGLVAQGAVLLSFADVLGDRHLTTALQTGNGLMRGFSASDMAAQLAYVDQRRRWNWGTAFGQLPFISGGVQVNTAAMTPQGPVAVTKDVLFRRLEQSAELGAAYPFNRAARFEVGGRMSRLAFDRVTETTVSSLSTAEVLDQQRDATSIAAPLVIGTARTALVFDTSDLGAISPVRGQRYRLEAAPTVGTIDFVDVLADYRRYIMPAPFYTIAMRVLHSGRYGSGAEDSRLLPFYVGHPSLVRGYDLIPLDLSACALNALVGCSSSDPLMGSRALVGNLEFRMPLLRPLGVTRRMYSALPTELALFADGGTAWNRGERPSFLGGSRTPAASAGLTVRTNVRFALAAFTIARTMNRPDRDWVFQFNLAPGF